MDAPNDERRPRATLRGKGRAILLGQRPLPSENVAPPDQTPPAERDALRLDPASLRLSAEETRALFDLRAPLPVLDETLPLMPGRPAAPPPREPEPAPAVQRPAPAARAVPEVEEALADLPDWLTASGQADDVPVIVGRDKTSAPPAAPDDAQPLAERESPVPARAAPVPYEPHPAVESLTPGTPEAWSSEPKATTPAEAEPAPPPAPPRAAAPESAAAEPSPPASEAAAPPLVDDERLRKLAAQIEAVQDDLARRPSGDADVVLGYQQALADASRMLAESRESYEAVRATVYRIRTEINRQRKTDADIARYRPLLLNYMVGWVIALGVLFLLKALFVGVGEAVGVPIVGALYYPLLLGIAGALLAGYLTLERHTTRLRDFDPIHISWYLFNPLLGGVMGLLAFLVVSIANEDLLRDSATEAEYAMTYLLCFVAGMNQTPILRTLHDVLRRFGRGN